MTKNTYLTFILAVFASISILNAQQFKQFSGKTETYTKEVNQFIGESISKEHGLVLDAYILNWDSLKFSNEEKEKIIGISKCFVEKKIRALPEYYNFIVVLQEFLIKDHPRQSFGAWLDGIATICSIKKTTGPALNRIVEHTRIVLQENTIYRSVSINWKPEATNYHYIFDGELQLVFDNCNLKCYAKHDSITIFNTSGRVYPASNTWVGKKGEVTWERAGYDKNTINSFLDVYKIDLTKSSFQADSVTFINKTYFDKPLLGSLEDMVSHIIKSELALYPRFESYKKEFEIKDLYPNVNYKGGFSMQGAKLVGQGSQETPAVLDFYRRDTLRFKATSIFFIFRPEKIKGIDAGATIYLEKDSIYHSDLQFTYTTKNSEVSLMRSENYSAQSPFMDSYHKIDMNFEQLVWRIDDPIVLLTTTPGSSLGKALFESENFFNYKEFTDLQYYDESHPLVLLKKFAKQTGSNKFSALDFADFAHKTIENVRIMIFPLAIKGFLFYDVPSETIELKSRLFDNLSASIGKIDYDVLRFFSRTEAPLENATLDLRNNDLKINGIPQVFVSDSQNVAIIPKGESIILKRNRNFQFDGTVSAGLFTFYGKNFFFNYDEFKVTLKDVDSVQLKVIVGYDNFEKPIYKNVSNVIQDVTGDILIDKPDNKSGLKPNPDYPIFNSRGYSYVYYDSKTIFNGIYDRKKNFGFRIEPYVLDSLDNFTKEGMNFKGILSSANILPDIDEHLRLQEDFSLGFKHNTPAEGYPLYGGKGRFNKLIHLSNQGLRGNGYITYIASKSQSNDILFFPDSANTTTQDFTIEARPAGVQFPSTSADTVKIHWEPYKDQMFAQNLKKPFSIFNKEGKHNGLLTITPKGLTGKGTLDLTAAVAQSKKFIYKHHVIEADTSHFSLRSLHTDGFTVRTSNVKANIDLSTRIGKFKSNDLEAITEFPENKYIAMLDEFTWKMNKKELEMISARKQNASTDGEKYGFKDEPLLGSNFISTRENQDSLKFVSPLAVYDYEKNLLNATKVKYIEVADARIFPDKENVTINPEGYMQTFSNAKLMANRETRFHNIYQSQITVKNRNDYEGNGKYDYKDMNNAVQVLTFNQIRVDSLRQSYAEGTITEPDDFTLSPRFPYQGKVELFAKNKYLTFDGATKIISDCPNYFTSWFLFDTIVNPTELKIPIGNKVIEINRKNIVSGTLITTDSIHVYSSFFGERKNHTDSVVANANGVLRYNETNLSYEIASEEKLKNRSSAGNYLRVNTKTCQQYIEGTVNPGVNYGQFKHKNAGVVEHDLKANVIKVNMSMALDFVMFDKAMERMAYMVDSLCKTPLDYNQDKIKKNFINLVDEKVLNGYYENLAKSEKPKEIPAPFMKNIFIDDVNLVWDDVSNSYRSKGKIGIGFIAGRPIHKYVEGYMELWRKRSGDLFDLYIKIDENNYFYIAYTRGTLQVASSDLTFNTMIRELSEADRTLKVGRGQMPYSYTMATEHKLMQLRKRWLSGATEVGTEAAEEEPENVNTEESQPALEIQPEIKNENDSIK